MGGPHTRQRPAAVPLWALVHGVLGDHPTGGVLVLAAANSVFAVCLALLLAEVLPRATALAVAAVWVLVPSHTSLESWSTCVNIAWSQAAMAVGILVGWRASRRWWHLAAAAGCFAFAVLAYEANVAVGGLAVLALPWVRDRRPDWPLAVATGTASVAALAWVATHWFEGKQLADRLAPVHDSFVANTAWGFTAPGSTAKWIGVAALAALAAAGGRLLLPSFRPATGTGERMMVVGAGVVVAGALPFVRYVYEPLGAGDRVNGLSAVGGALFLVGVAALVGRVSRPAVVLLVAVGVAAAGVARAERMERWHLAGRDADAIVAAAVRAVPRPAGTLVFGPEPIVKGRILAFLERTSISSAVQLAYDDRSLRAEMSPGEEAFHRVPADLRIDIRPLSRLDDS